MWTRLTHFDYDEHSQATTSVTIISSIVIATGYSLDSASFIGGERTQFSSSTS